MQQIKLTVCRENPDIKDKENGLSLTAVLDETLHMPQLDLLDTQNVSSKKAFRFWISIAGHSFQL